jgi:hypothetical protein
MVVFYNSYFAKGNTWEFSFQQAMIDTYVLYFNTKIIPSDTQSSIDTVINMIKKTVSNDYADVSNGITLYTLNFKPTVPVNYSLSPYYLLHVNNYDFTHFLGDMGVSYNSYFAKGNTWESSFQQAMIDTYVLYFNTKILPVDTQGFIDTTINMIKKGVSDDHADVSNWIALYTVNFKPILPTSYYLYTYQPVNTKSFYMNFKSESIVFKDVIDIFLGKSDFYVPSSIIESLTQSTPDTYINVISTINTNDIKVPIEYTYFDPLDIYVNPTNYTFSGIGIVDNSQPGYILLVEKSEELYLNRLLKDSSNTIGKTPINSWFTLPDYTIIWKDEWCDLFNSNDANPILDGINKILSLQNIKPIQTTDTSVLFTILPSSYYWVITLLSLIKTVPNQSDLFYYLKDPGLNVETCKDNCIDNCMSIFDQYYGECSSFCDDGESNGPPRCDLNCAITAQQGKNYYCGKNKDQDYQTYFGNDVPSVNTCIKTNCTK